MLFLLFICITGFIQVPEVITKNHLHYNRQNVSDKLIKHHKSKSLITFSKNCKLYGYWDSVYAPDNAPANVFKGYTDELDRLSQRGKLIPMISGFRNGDTKLAVRSRLKQHLAIIDRYDNVEFVLLHDEPRQKGLSVELLEMIVDEAKKINGRYKYAFTFSRGNARNADLPSNVDVLGINFYPFYYQSYYPQRYFTTKEQFNDHLSSTVRLVKSKVPNAEIFIVGQGFYDRAKYRKPPLESPRWYAEYVQNHEEIIGLLWFEWRDRQGWKGSGSMSDLHDVQDEVFRGICKD